MLVGFAGASSTGILASSETNDFDSLIDGITISVNEPSTEAVSVTVEQSSSSVVSQLKLFAEQYNKLQDKIDELAFFNETDNSTGVLFGSSSVLRIQFDLSNTITSRHFGAGSIQSLGEVGLSLNSEGRLIFDESRFQDKYDADRRAVEQFFAQDGFGVAQKLFDTVEGLAGVTGSVLVSRVESLQLTIDSNASRVTALSERLNTERERLLLQFFRLEGTISQLQGNLSALSQIQALTPLTSTRN